jgi:hypothetical protein
MAVGMDVEATEALARALGEAADRVAAGRDEVRAALAVRCMASGVPSQLAAVAAWAERAEADVRRRAAPLLGRDGGRRGWSVGSVASIGSAFGRGVWQGTGDLIGGTLSTVQLLARAQATPARYFSAGLHGWDRVREEVTSDGGLVTALGRNIPAMVTASVVTGIRMNPITGPAALQLDARRRGWLTALSSLSYEAGKLAPEAAVTVASAGASKLIVAAKASRVGAAGAALEAESVAAAVVIETRPLTAAERITHPLWTKGRRPSPARNALWHFGKHRADFPQAKNALEYAAMAHDFLNRPPAGTLSIPRTTGEIVRYNEALDWYGVVRSDGTPKSLYRPDPAKHGYRNNLEYFYGRG